MKTFQSVLLQTDGQRVFLLPAWPTELDVEFRLHTPQQTIVEGVYRDGKVQSLRVTPASRRGSGGPSMMFLASRRGYRTRLSTADPWIRPLETLEEDAAQVIVKTGCGAVMRKRFEHPMPETTAWDLDECEKLERVQFDDPADPRRFNAGGDNRIAGVGDGFQRDTPPWLDTVKSLRGDFPVYGSMIEVSECLTRLVGQVHAMLWMAEYRGDSWHCPRWTAEGNGSRRQPAQQRAEDWRHDSLWRWTQQPEPPPRRLSPWRLPRPSHCRRSPDSLAPTGRAGGGPSVSGVRLADDLSFPSDKPMEVSRIPRGNTRGCRISHGA